MNDLSPMHEMLGKIERRYDAVFTNKVANHPTVVRWIKGYLPLPIDLTEGMGNRNNVQLVGEHGVMVFHRIQYGLYECHTMVLPAGRGQWCVDFVTACLHWMFTKTDMMEFLTKVPKGNLRALALVRKMKLCYDFTSQNGWVMDNDPIPADIYSMHAQGWIRNAQGLRERGAWFHLRLHEEFERFGKTEASHPDDPWHDVHVGAACEMIFGGQLAKAQVFYNRFAAAGGMYAPMEIVGDSPTGVVINIKSAIISVRDGDFSVVSCL